MRSQRWMYACAHAAAALWLLACGSDDAMQENDDDQSAATEESPAMNGDQTPPQGAAALMAWLEAGKYEDWACEDDIHEARSPSPHGWNRICSNEAISEHAAGTGDWPAGAAAVKELYADATATVPIGYAVYLKTKADSADGANWYWYEVVPSDHPAPHDENGIVADGMGDDGPAKKICVSCHGLAGSDDMHSPSAGGRDQVYTPVR